MSEPTTPTPNWDQLYEAAAAQEGLLTTQQAAQAGYSPQLLVHHVRTGKLLRVQRGIYRLVHFPAGDHEDLVVAWLWSEMAGVASHETALALHGLSDVLPARLHLTLPLAWKRRRFRVPPEVVLHHADIPPEDRAWFGAVPMTNARRTLIDWLSRRPQLLGGAPRQTRTWRFPPYGSSADTTYRAWPHIAMCECGAGRG